MSIHLSGHKIDAYGTGVVCTASPDATCRTMPDCDTLTFTDTGCDDHDPQHPATPGHECWAIEWINAPIDIELRDCADDPYDDDLEIVPGRSIILTPHGDEGVTWSYDDSPNQDLT